jgi:hypothetical protein
VSPGSFWEFFGLSGFAFAQPLYHLLGENAPFFTHHGAQPLHLLFLVTALSLGPPLIIALFLLPLARLHPRLGRLAHRASLAALVALTVLPPLHSVLTGWWALPVSLLLGVGFFVAYSRALGVRAFTRYLAVPAVIFPALFLTTSPAASLLAPSPPAAAAGDHGELPPIVFVIFDELPLSALLTSDGRIDAELFPNFAQLADSSDWFPRARAVADGTAYALPAMLTGAPPEPGPPVPIAQRFPDNLFTILAPEYRLNVHETVTRLCPVSLCETQEPFFDVMRDLSVDVGVVYLHVVLPAVARGALPPISHTWGDFVNGGRHDVAPEDPGGWTKLVHSHARDDRSAQFAAFLRSLPDAQAPPTLSFLHSMLPHMPYVYNPSGTTYPRRPQRGLLENVWVDDEVAVRSAYLRFVLQTQFVDRLLGELIERLRATGTFDETLLVVTVDHGVSFRPGAPRRSLTPENALEMLSVPLFLKRPGQPLGRRIEREVDVTQIVPTILQLLDVDMPRAMPAPSLLSDEPSNVQPFRGGAPISLPDAAHPLEESPDGQWLRVEDQRPARLYSLGIRPELIGRHLDGLRWTVSPSRRVSLDGLPPTRVAGGLRLASTHLAGLIEAPGDATGTRELAVAVDGRIVAITQTYAAPGGRQRFSVYLPERAAEGQPVTLDLLDVSDPQRAERLPLLHGEQLRPRLELDGRGQPARLHYERRSIPLAPGRIRGVVEFAELTAPHLVIKGWAADTESERPPDRVLLFAGESFVAASSPDQFRPDVARHFGMEGVARSGFFVSVPSALCQRLPIGSGEYPLIVVAVSGSAIASVLPVEKGARAPCADG